MSATGPMPELPWVAAPAAEIALRQRGHALLLQGHAGAGVFELALRGQADDSPAAWRTLHEAFDRAAGEVARPATLARLFARAPHLRPLHGRIERFFAQSQARFFGEAPTSPLAQADAESPLALCRALRRLERGAER